MEFINSIEFLTSEYNELNEKYERMKIYKDTSAEWLNSTRIILKELESAIEFLETGHEQLEKMKCEKEIAELRERGHHRAIGLLEKELEQKDELEKYDKNLHI